MDVKNACLNGDLQEVVCMVLPPSFIVKGLEGEVCQLKKAFYGLKLSPQAWFDSNHLNLELAGLER